MACERSPCAQWDSDAFQEQTCTALWYVKVGLTALQTHLLTVSPDPSLLAMEIQPFTKDAWSLSPIVAEQVPWFKGKDVATSLEYTNPAKALRDHVDDEDKKSFNELSQGVNVLVPPSNQQPHEVYINESGLYGLALGQSSARSRIHAQPPQERVVPVSYTHLTLPTKRIV